MPIMSDVAVAVRDPQLDVAAGRAVRLTALDLWRGAVMVLMAIDHVRVYSGVPAGGPDPGVFFTRWVTHFCAPGFVFLAGTAAFLHGRTLGERRGLSRYLLTRGVMLVLLELTVIRLSWTFSTASLAAPLAGVIWMLGWCMVLMSWLVALPIRAIAVFGLITIFAQDLLGPIAGALPPSLAWVGQFLYTGGGVESGPVSVSVLYSIVPWIGLMAAGYAFGEILLREPARRRRACLRIGVTATLLFLILTAIQAAVRGVDGEMPALFQLLDQRKYPASQLYLLMTLGPPIALLPIFERATGPVARVLTTFGRVPMFYYLLHIPLIHVLALAVWKLRDGQAHAGWFASAPFVSVEPAARWSLPLLYLVFAVAVAILYVACRWFAALKARSDSRWLRYV